MTTGTERILGIDLGAGSLKATVIDAGGAVLGEGSHPVKTSNPHFGWSEQDPEGWYLAFCRAAQAALTASAVAPAQIVALGVSAGAHTNVLLDADDKVIRPAIMWNDQRSGAETEELHARAGEEIIRTSLNRVNPTWTLAQLAWLKRHEPEAVARTKRLFLAKDYLRFRITGDWHSDFSDAVGALMADAETQGWSEALCDLIGWPMDRLPPIAAPTDVVGRVTAQAAQDSGLIEGTPVVLGSNDTTVEFFGAGAVSPGQGAIKLATAAVVYCLTEGPAVHPPISCYPGILPGTYYTATGTNSCASAHRWLRDRFFLPYEGEARKPGGEVFGDMDSMAAQVAPGAEGLLFHPYLLGERAPHWDPYLRARFIGMTMRHDRPHFVRALYEGIAFSVRDLLESCRSEGLDITELRIIGGGARSAIWRQIISDVIGMEILLPTNGDASFGAALVAGVGVGLFESAEAAVTRCAQIVDRSRPDPARHEFYSKLFEIYRDAQSCLGPLDHRLHALCEGA